MNGARAFLSVLAGTALAGALSSGAGAQTAGTTTSGGTAVHTTDAGVALRNRLQFQLRANPIPSHTPSLLTATPSASPVNLHVDPDIETALRNGEDLILDREYDQALALFATVGQTHKDSAIGPLGEMLVWQSQMLENNDFAHTKEYEAAAKDALKRIDAVRNPGSWDRMLQGGFYGVRAMHAMRQKRYFKAIDDGWTALSEMKSLKKDEPGLADSDVGLGTYDYWRSVITRSVKWLPFVADRRKQGIAEIERAMVDAQYVRPIAQLVLVFIYIDERRFDDAITLGEDLCTRFPHNTLVRVQLGRAYTRKARYADAIALYQLVLEMQPDNKVAGYYLGANLLYEGRDLDGAETYLTKFVADAPGNDWRGWGNERLGDIAQKRGKTARAIELWNKSLQDNPDDDGVKSKIKHAHDSEHAPATPVPGKGPGTLP